MSRVHYRNKAIRRAMGVLDDLEQSIGRNLVYAYTSCNTREESMQALAQILEHFPMVRRLLDQVDAEVLKCFVDAPDAPDAPTDEAPDRHPGDRLGSALGSLALIIQGEEGMRCFGPFDSDKAAGSGLPPTRPT
jgi:hypothetical protein